VFISSPDGCFAGEITPKRDPNDPSNPNGWVTITLGDCAS
jgi:hypothetical protein